MTKDEKKDQKASKESKQDNAKDKKSNKKQKKEQPDKKTKDKKSGKKSNRKDKKKSSRRKNRKRRSFNMDSWSPKTSLGIAVKQSKIKNIDEILDKGIKIMEPKIVDALIPNLTQDLLLAGQSKGKFGGGKRRVFKQTQKKTPEGNKPSFTTYAIVGNQDGYVGVGKGKAKETVPAREKAFRRARLNIIKIRRGCGSWECGCKEQHSIPFGVEGKNGSVKIKLMPAPKGAGLVVEKECQRILEAAGIKDVYSHTLGQTQTKVNLIKACVKALKMLMSTRVRRENYDDLGIVEGSIK